MKKPFHVMMSFALCVASSCRDAEETVDDQSNAPAKVAKGIIEARLDSIVIPKVDFVDCSVEEAVDFARLRTIDCDPEEDPTRKGFSLLIRYPRSQGDNVDTELSASVDLTLGATMIDYAATDVTLTTLLIEIAKRAGLDLHITSVAIVFCPRGEPPFPNAKGTEVEIYQTLYRAGSESERDTKANKTQ